ncbi:MAG TPA: hypothetical protein VFR29_07175 [Steroidobacteraceae bacterium]|nr:hypothetical protein [Steroidobacteraceae bacterium]
MMQDDDKLPDRDAWRRLLQRGAGEPPRATDERIRAEARRALAPHTGRWWLPASLAASLLLAVLVVQWQYEEIRPPALVTESDVAPAAEDSAAAAAAEQSSVPAPMADFAPADAPPAAAPPAERPAGKAAPAAMPPRQMEEHAESAERAAPSLDAQSAPVTGVTPSASVRAREISAGEAESPEAWYARIERLRAAGRHEEAEAELRRLEEAHPGWLERRRRNEEE